MTLPNFCSFSPNKPGQILEIYLHLANDFGKFIRTIKFVSITPILTIPSEDYYLYLYQPDPLQQIPLHLSMSLPGSSKLFAPLWPAQTSQNLFFPPMSLTPSSKIIYTSTRAICPSKIIYASLWPGKIRLSVLMSLIRPSKILHTPR